MRGKIICEIEKCLGCRNCQIACALSHSEAKSLAEAISLDSLPLCRLKIEPRTGGGGIPNLCRHCEDAPCIAECKFDALVRERPGGPVILKMDLCKGCKKCMKACTYGVLKMQGEGKNRKAVKCDFCIDRLAKGGEPACVIACPTRALKFIRIDEPEKVTSDKKGVECLVKVIGSGVKDVK